MKEIWKDIEGFEGLYQVSNLGRVKALERVTMRKDGRKLPCQEKILKNETNNCGYYRVTLHKEGKKTRKFVHVLVAEHFIGKRPEKYVVNHIDEIKTNNHAVNLEYITPKENNNHGTHNIRVAKTRGRKVLGISSDGKHAMVFWGINEAERHGFDHSNIWSCCEGKRKHHKGYTWSWLDE